MERRCRRGEAVIAGMGGHGMGAWNFLRDAGRVDLDQIASQDYTRNAQTHNVWDPYAGMYINFSVAYFPPNQVPALSDVVVISHWTPGNPNNSRMTRYYGNGACDGVFSHKGLDFWARACGYAPQRYRPNISNFY